VTGASAKDTGHDASDASAGIGDEFDPSSARDTVAQLEPAQRVCHTKRPKGAGVRGSRRAPSESGLATEGRGQATPAADRRQLVAHELDLPRERRPTPRAGIARAVVKRAAKPDGIQRQRTMWRQRWSGSEPRARWEEILGRRRRTGRRVVAWVRRRNGVGSARSNDDRHVPTVAVAHQRVFTVR
jgi:hypothetical protein